MIEKLNDYMDAACATAVYPDDRGMEYCSLKLCGEAGEHAEKVAKLYFRGDFHGKTVEDIEAARSGAIAELGDTLWYLANLCVLHGTTLQDVANGNINKLRGRVERGTLKGSGDLR